MGKLERIAKYRKKLKLILKQIRNQINRFFCMQVARRQSINLQASNSFLSLNFPQRTQKIIFALFPKAMQCLSVFQLRLLPFPLPFSLPFPSPPPTSHSHYQRSKLLTLKLENTVLITISTPLENTRSQSFNPQTTLRLN